MYCISYTICTICTYSLTLQRYLQPMLVKILVRDLESSNFCRQEPAPLRRCGKAQSSKVRCVAWLCVSDGQI